MLIGSTVYGDGDPQSESRQYGMTDRFRVRC
jgi:hypothetical protein